VVTGVAWLFGGPGELRERCRALDWAAVPLGPVEGWPPVLYTAVRLLLDTPSAASESCSRRPRHRTQWSARLPAAR
jgi:hypothetical protein